jgi:hypothetical protein
MIAEQTRDKVRAKGRRTAPTVTTATASHEQTAKPERLFRRIDWICFAVTAFLIMAGYMYTLAPDLTLEDSGELAVASMYAGVPHPPGYPVWTLYTWVFTKILPFSNIAWRVGVSSAFAAAMACGLIALMVSRGSSMLIQGIAELKFIDQRIENATCVVSGLVAGLLLGFNGFMWSQAVIVEVYTLSVLSLAGVLVSLLRWIYAPRQHRYLYLAFFLFGICFNNHQSLLVIVLGMEIAIIVVQPRLARDLFFWNVVCWMAGLAGKKLGMIGVLNDNPSLFLHYNLIGLGSLAVWVVLLVKTRKKLIELGRDLALVGSLAYGAALLLHVMSFVTAFYYNGDLHTLKTGGFVMFNVLGLGCIAAQVYLGLRAKGLGREWIFSLVCGGAFALGAAFYIYLPIGSMSNPPLNWGYPRTVGGFFHAFTRGQYEKIQPTFGHSLISDVAKYAGQVQGYCSGVLEEFNVVLVLIGALPLLFFRRMQPRERAWIVTLGAIYFFLSFFLLDLFNPGADRQSRDLNKVFFTASHVMIAMGIGYGLALAAAALATNFQRVSVHARFATALAVILATTAVVVAFVGTANPLVHRTAILGLFLATVAAALIWFSSAVRRAVPIYALLGVFALSPIHSILLHWEQNEQRGHLFGFWFGHDMFTPPFQGRDGKPIYPEMEKHSVLFGGTDPGRFNPTYMIFCDSFIPPKFRRDPDFDRRDVYLITQNALADPPYLNYIRAHYNRSAQIDPPFFSELLRGAREFQIGDFTNIVARAVAPLDRFLLNVGDSVEKNRRVESSFFKESDFVDVSSFASKLHAQQDSLSRHIHEHLSSQTKLLLGGSVKKEELVRAFTEDLNALLDSGESLYTTNQFQHVRLSDHLQRFVEQNPRGHTLVRLNRLLLEEAYPDDIRKSSGGLYPDREIHTPSYEESQVAFSEYVADAQRRWREGRLRPGEDVQVIDNRVQVKGQVAVMAINALLTKVIFDKNPGHEFYLEESFPLDWMYPHLTPFGIIMKINRNPVGELTEEVLSKDHQFWTHYSERLAGNWITYDITVAELCHFVERVNLRRDYKHYKGDLKFIGDSSAQKAFSKLRSSIAGLYAWRISELGRILQQAATPAAEAQKLALEQQRVLREAEFAFKQAYAFCPYSPEAVFRYAQLLAGIGRLDDASLIVRTALKLDPYNGSLRDLANQLDGMRQLRS